MYQPIYHYLNTHDLTNDATTLSGPFRKIKLDERIGFNAESIKSRLILPHHNLNQACGTLTLWFFSLEDLGTAAEYENFKASNPFSANYSFLSDNESHQNFDDSVFSINWDTHWYPQFYFKFYKGKIYPDGYKPDQKAFAAAGHLNILKHVWYQVSITWDKKNNTYKLYVNGLLIGRSDAFVEQLTYEKVGEKLFAGNPCLCLSDIQFFDIAMNDAEITDLFDSQVLVENEAIQSALRNTFKGASIYPFDMSLDEQWINKLDLTLQEPAHLDRFYVQGCSSAPSISSEGLLVETPQNIPKHNIHAQDFDQVYLWTDQAFEGDLYVEYEFMPLKERGLSLLMVQASGMQREDFMKDYPLRTNGSMLTVCWEDVRNYHWEYYRQMNDTRNDVASHALIKNPWFKPLGYVCAPYTLDINVWHKLQFFQEGNHIRCIMDGQVVLDVTDDGFTNNGPVLNFGRIAIRCMVRTSVLFRNFKVYNKQSTLTEFVK